MKSVKLLVTKGTNKQDSIVEYDDSSADWLIMNGYGLEVTTEAPAKASGESEEEAAPAPRRGRPRKDKS